MFDPDAHLPRINRGMVYLGACLIAGIRLARGSAIFQQKRLTICCIIRMEFPETDPHSWLLNAESRRAHHGYECTTATLDIPGSA